MSTAESVLGSVIVVVDVWPTLGLAMTSEGCRARHEQAAFIADVFIPLKQAGSGALARNVFELETVTVLLSMSAYLYLTPGAS